jgi:hypothetical protein
LNLNRSVSHDEYDGRKPEGAPERSPKAGVGVPSGVDGNGPKRFSVQRNERDDRDDEIVRLKSKVGGITMDNELLYAKIEALEGKRPLAHRRSRR